MNLVELDQALRKLRLSGMADVLETRLLHAQTEQMAPIDLLAALVSDELQRREDRLLARRHKQARFRDPDRALDGFDFAFNKKINRALVFELSPATIRLPRALRPARGGRRPRESRPRRRHHARSGPTPAAAASTVSTADRPRTPAPAGLRLQAAGDERPSSPCAWIRTAAPAS